MATIFIDQKPYEVNQSANLLEAALSKGLDLPYFCWHPALGSVGSCRQCAVQQFSDESDQQGRTVMACMTPLKEGSRFSIKHPSCTDFRKSVIEWMMLNHPHDCPVCDEGGECHLQDMTMMTGHHNRTTRFKKRTFNNQNLGPLVNHEMNRCITCYRCVRFYKDLAGGQDLHAFSSSSRVYFGRHESGVLTSEFSGNLAEVCPTGVFTDKIFHQHFTRKWDLETAPSICQLCSVGCNISPGARMGLLRRVQNRYNHSVNGYFICDRGRFGHDFVNSPQRLSSSSHDLAHIKVLLADAKNIIGIASPRASLEANWMLKKLVGPGNFYDGEHEIISQSVNEALNLMSSGVALASLSDIREADAIVVIGEDLTHSAPMMALSIRQAVANFSQQRALKEQQIATWNDAAVRDYVRGNALPFFSAHVSATALDDLSENCYQLHPLDLGLLAIGLGQALNGDNISVELPTSALAFVDKSAQALKEAKRPVIISGVSLAQPGLLVELARIKTHAKFSLVLPEFNSLGLALLKPQPLSKLTTADYAIVLENDLVRRLGEHSFGEFKKSVKKILVIDSLNTNTIKRADTSVACLSFAETTGTSVSQEGRLQRFFSVYKNNWPGVESSWRILGAFMDTSSQALFATNDQVCAAMAEDLAWPAHCFTDLYLSNFAINGHGVARQSSEYSGRTALYAHISMHEPSPPQDPDSPLVYSMEGARRKIPLPLVSSSWQPSWNSVQASFIDTLKARDDQDHQACRQSIFDLVKPSAKPPSRHATSDLNQKQKPQFYLVPEYNIFTSEERAAYSSLSSRAADIKAKISQPDAQALGLADGSVINLSSEKISESFTVAVDHKLVAGVITLPFGLVDSTWFYHAVRVS